MVSFLRNTLRSALLPHWLQADDFFWSYFDFQSLYSKSGQHICKNGVKGLSPAELINTFPSMICCNVTRNYHTVITHHHATCTLFMCDKSAVNMDINIPPPGPSPKGYFQQMKLHSLSTHRYVDGQNTFGVSGVRSVAAKSNTIEVNGDSSRRNETTEKHNRHNIIQVPWSPETPLPFPYPYPWFSRVILPLETESQEVVVEIVSYQLGQHFKKPLHHQ